MTRRRKMSDWLADLNADRVFNYRFEDGSVVSGTLKELNDMYQFGVNGTTLLTGEPGEGFVTFDGRCAEYAGFEPVKLGQRSSVMYEKNGRKAYMQRDSNGNISYVSATKMHYLKTGKIENQYSSDYQAVIEKQVQAEVYNSQKQQADKSIHEAIKHLADGEYVSDGVNFIDADKYKEDIKSAQQKG